MIRTTGTYKQCKHSNGWWQRIKFWIFTKEVFCCEDCSECIDIREWKRVKRLRVTSPYSRDNDGTEEADQA